MNHLIKKSSMAFTMAEILLSLTIIGVVAAITLPSLMGNINERTWQTQRKAFYARMSQAIAMMPQLNGFGKYSATSDDAGSVTVSTDTAAEAFITEGLSKIIKINNICDSDHLKDCGLPEQMYQLNGSVAYSALPKTANEFNSNIMSWADWHEQVFVKTAAFETQNGESVLLVYMPSCSGSADNLGYMYRPVTSLCANFVFDLNGNKGPNTMGKDIGILSAFYPTDSVVVSPMLLGVVDETKASIDVASMSTYCRNNYEQSSRAANIEEVFSLIMNQKLGTTNGNYIMSSTTADPGTVWAVDIGSQGVLERVDKNINATGFACVRQ